MSLFSVIKSKNDLKIKESKSHSFHIREKPSKTPLVNQKPVPLHFEYYSKQSKFTREIEDQPKFLELWGCPVPDYY